MSFMNYESLLVKAMLYDHPEEIPISVGILPSMWMRHSGEVLELVRRFPDICGDYPADYDYREHIPRTYHVGAFTDEWGCVWENIEEGMESMVKGHPLKTREDILSAEIPPNRDGRLPHGFMYLRLLDLRGFEEAMVDFADECDELNILIEKVTEYNCIQMSVAAGRPGRVVYVGDDLGMQNGLAIGAEKWRRYLKPSFKRIYDVAREAGKLVYMHTDGMIYEIIPDLFETGINIVNPQFRANGLDNLVRVCKGKHPMDLDLDRQLFPFATPAQCAEHVRQCVEALYLPSGGLSIKIEIGHDVPLDNMEALLETANRLRFYKG
jgi:hypothetical protein